MLQTDKALVIAEQWKLPWVDTKSRHRSLLTGDCASLSTDKSAVDFLAPYIAIVCLSFNKVLNTEWVSLSHLIAALSGRQVRVTGRLSNSHSETGRGGVNPKGWWFMIISMLTSTRYLEMCVVYPLMTFSTFFVNDKRQAQTVYQHIACFEPRPLCMTVSFFIILLLVQQ